MRAMMERTPGTRLRSPWVFGLLVWALCGTGCYKDKDLPPAPLPAEGPVSLRFDLIVGTELLTLHAPIVDLYGNRLVITRLKFVLADWALRDDDDQLVADLPGAVVLVDGTRPSEVHALGRMGNGHIHAVEYAAGAADAVVPDPDLLLNGVPVHLLLQGFVDRDGDGAFDGAVDQAFDYRPAGAEALRDRHMHLHADMVGGAPVTLWLELDVRFLLAGVDPMERPVAEGADSVSLRLMDNLVSMTWAGS